MVFWNVPRALYISSKNRIVAPRVLFQRYLWFLRLTNSFQNFRSALIYLPTYPSHIRTPSGGSLINSLDAVPSLKRSGILSSDNFPPIKIPAAGRCHARWSQIRNPRAVDRRSAGSLPPLPPRVIYSSKALGYVGAMVLVRKRKLYCRLYPEGDLTSRHDACTRGAKWIGKRKLITIDALSLDNVSAARW